MSEVLYRKYRSKDFDSLVGQDHITKILKHQVKLGEFSHAYLFTGTRGTGKTSAAKILSRAVNCQQPRDGNPCNECEHCVGILNEQLLDVVEMDAASNNSVDDIRELRDKVIYAPAVLPYRVYIIDEVHMLSKGAFNALLKILEEPPNHLIFILATTEPERIPATILSRCQRYDFHRISALEMVSHMEHVVAEEDRTVDDKVYKLISRHADGAMRDALSLLDQCLALTDGFVSYEDALNSLGVTDEYQLLEVAKAVIEGDSHKILNLVGELKDQGKDIQQLMVDLIGFYRQWLTIYMVDEQPELMEDDLYVALEELKADQDVDLLLLRISELIDAQAQMKWAPLPEVILEVTLLKLQDPTRLDATAQIEELEARVKTLERALQEGNVKPVSREVTPTRERSTGELKSKPAREMSESKKVEQTDSAKAPEPTKKIEKQVPKAEDVEEKDEMSPVSMRAGGMEAETGIDETLWAQYLEAVKELSIPTNAFLKDGKPLQFAGDVLVIGFEEGFGFHYNALSNERNKEVLKEAANNLWQRNVEVRLELMEKSSEDRRQQAINKVIETFGDDIVEIE